MAHSPLTHRALLALLLLGALPGSALLGTNDALAVELTGQIRGQVTDADGLPVPGAAITVSSPKMQGTMEQQSDAEGRYRFINLPPGEYTITVQRSGFAPSTRTARISAGGTVTLNLVISSETAEEMVITGDRPTVDVTTTQSGLNMSKEVLRDIPNAGRDYQSAAQRAPGVVGGGNPNMRGGLSYGNQIHIDGVNTTDPSTNTFSANMNFDAIEEIEVITGGMDAEYGKALGGIINIITRSGGNEFEGDFQVLYDSTATRIYTPLPDENPDEDPENTSLMMAANVGGPLIKDKLWFFTSLQGNFNNSTAFVPEEVRRPEPMQTENWRSAYLFGKLTWRPSSAHRIWVQGQADPTRIENASRDIYTLPSAEYYWQQGGWLGSIGHNWTPNSAILVESQVYAQNSYLGFMPDAWRDCEKFDGTGYCTDNFSNDYGPWLANDPDGFSYGTFPYAYESARNRYSLNSKATFFFDALGSHQARIGVQAEVLNSSSSYPGQEYGIEYWSYTTSPDDLASYVPTQRYVYDSNQASEFTGTLVSWYVQDVWNPHPRLTVRPGVRFDYGNFNDDIGNSVYSTLVAAPRLGAAYDLSGDGRTRIHAYYGRFYDPGFLEISSLLAKSQGGYDIYDWDARAEQWSDTPSSGSAADLFLVHDDLRTPYSDEFDIGVEKDLGDGWAMGVTMTYEETHNLWEDDEVNLIWNEEGTNVIGSRDGSGTTYYRLRTPDEAFSQYTSLELQANKQFNEKWGMISSYTWSRAYGMFRNDVSQGLASYSFDIDPQIQYERGLSAYDVPHNIKVAGSYKEPKKWELSENTSIGYLFGWSFEMSSGYPYRPAYYTDFYGGWYTYKQSLDETWRLPAYSRSDLKGGITLAQGKTTWDLTLECFNAFNNRTVTSVSTVYDNPDGTVRVDDDGLLVFGSPNARQSPRYFQLGLRGEF
ncbi:MAG: TonB-dependent receptor [Myxococcota bacterium]|nr:TonB-dependent receptor [Myxococcota bacterium]